MELQGDPRSWGMGGEWDWGTGGKRTTETLSGFCWGSRFGLINIPIAAAVKMSLVHIIWQRMLSVTKFIDCLSI